MGAGKTERRGAMSRRELILDQLTLARNDPALASMRDSGLFADLAALEARSHGERVRGAVSADWVGPTTVRICYDVDDWCGTRSAHDTADLTAESVQPAFARR